jgi:hypothetical protein
MVAPLDLRHVVVPSGRLRCELSAAAIPGNVDPHPGAGIDGAVEGLPEMACDRSISGLSVVVAHFNRDLL